MFNFDAEVDYGQIAAAVAREPWTREFFKRLQKFVTMRIIIIIKSTICSAIGEQSTSNTNQ